MNTDIDPVEEAFRSAFDVMVESTVDAATWEELTARIDTGTSPVASRRGSRVLAAVAAAAFVLVFIGGAALLFGAGTESVAPTGTAPATTLADIDQPAEPATTMAPVEEPTATAGFTCPPGSTPNQPGPPDQPRPDDWVDAAAFDPLSGQMLLLTTEGAFWAFDVCTNNWTAAPGPNQGIEGEVVYDVDSDRAISFDPTGDDELEDVIEVDVWAYEPATQMWTMSSDGAVGPHLELHRPEIQAVYDPVTGLVVIREVLTSQMWNYDVDTGTWTDVDQGDILPPEFTEDGPHAEVLTYDASVDRLILYVEGEVRGTWEFDIRGGRWEKHEPNIHPVPGLGWPIGDKFVYDEANQVSVLLNGDTLATYDASEHRWTILQYETILHDEMIWSDHPHMAYDSVNERMLVTGIAGGGVFAFNVATGELITLLEHTPWPWKGRFVIGGVIALTIGVFLAAFAAYSRRWQDRVTPS